MKVNYWMLFGVVCGVVLSFALIILIRRLIRGKWQLKTKYDERQKIAQGKAYRNGFWTLFGYVCLLLLLEVCDFVPSANSTVLLKAVLLIGMILGVIVYAVSCIILDAYIGLNDNLHRCIVTFGILFVANALLSLTGYRTGSHIWWLNLGAAIMIAVVLAALIIKALLVKEQETEEDEE